MTSRRDFLKGLGIGLATAAVPALAAAPASCIFPVLPATPTSRIEGWLAHYTSDEAISDAYEVYRGVAVHNVQWTSPLLGEGIITGTFTFSPR